MLKSYINIALRTLKRQKGYTLINVVGLSTGIMACLIILLYVRDAASYESHYPESEKIYRLTTKYGTQGRQDELAYLPARVLEVAYNSIPEAEYLTLLNGALGGAEILIDVDGEKILESNFYSADTSYFNIFQHDFIQGTAEEALRDPKNVVFTAKSAMKYFGSLDVFGKTFKINGADRVVGGVVEDFKGNTVLEFDMLMSTSRQTWIDPANWFPMNYHVFGKFNSQASADSFKDKLNALVVEEMGDQMESEGFSMGFGLEPFDDVFFNTSVEGDFNEKLPKNLMYSLIAVSLFILVIACINYINLSTAKSEKRAKEVGIRKVMGAVRSQLIWQFYGETFEITFISVIIGVVLTEVSLVPFNNILGTNLKLNLLGDPAMILGLLVITILVSLLSGSYPANFLSSFSPTKVLKGSASIKGGNTFRRVLVTLQFVVSVFLIVGTITVAKQMRFIQNKDMGYDREAIVYFKLSDGASRRAYEPMKEAYRQIPGVDAVTGSSNLISNVVSGWGAFMDGLPENVSISFKGHNGDEQFLETMGLELVAGESFINRSDLDSTVYYYINETGAAALGLTPEEAVGKKFGIWTNKMGTITGVVKDFHMNSVHSEIEPWAVYTGPDKYMSYMFARVNMSRLEDIKSDMAEIWGERVSTFPFEMYFVDESVKEAYEKDRQLGKLIVSFTALAIIIGCLGLFGLASYLAEKRTKEIGIRKVLGADVGKIVYLLSQEYIRIIIIANLIAWPLAFYFMDEWLSTFAYRININWTVFLLAAVSTALVAGITVSYQSIKAAISNPVNALRNE